MHLSYGRPFECIVVESHDSPATLDWLAEFFGGSFAISRRGTNGLRVGFRLGAPQPQELSQEQPCTCFTLDGQFLAHPRIADQGQRLSVRDQQYETVYEVDAAGRSIDVCGERDDVKSRQALMRVVREIATSQALADHGLPIHGACVAHHQKGILVSGHKGAGKTSLMLYLLSHADISFVTNDRAFAFPESTTPNTVRGMPTLVSIREESLELFPEWKSALAKTHYSREFTLAEAESRRKSDAPAFAFPLLSSPQLGRLLDRTSQSQVCVSTLVFPELVAAQETIETRLLSEEEATARLFTSGLMLPQTPVIPTELVKPLGFEYCIDQERLTELCRAFVRGIRVVVCRYGRAAFTDDRLFQELMQAE